MILNKTTIRIKWILAICLWNIGTSYAQGDWTWADVNLRTEMACENYPISMRCPGHDVMEIASAVYGRQNSDKCSASASETQNTNCLLPDAKDIVEERCNNETYCSFRVSSETFTDPCPGTKKYLEVKFKCVRYMFACPGSLTGIGKETVSTIDVHPQPGTWTKDPFYNTDHVFFASSGNTVSEYSSWENFENGNSLVQYTLTDNMAPGSLVVDDRNIYFVKESSRIIMKYSLITKSSTSQLLIPGSRGRNHRDRSDISIAVDEQGLWLVYTRGKGMITFSKLDKDDLIIRKSWTINRQIADSKYSFFICGVFYSVNSNSGKVDYSYNTNVETNQEKRGLNIDFDQAISPHQQSSQKTHRKSFLGYRATALTYNPRDQLLYLWDPSYGNAVFFKLHFDGKNPSEVSATTTRATTTTTTRPSTTTRPTTTTKSTKSSTSTTSTPESYTTVENFPTTSEFFPPDVYDREYCMKTTRNGLHWPLTKMGEVAKLQCLDQQGGFATWRCVRESSMLRPDWHVAGPDLSDCITWASDIASDSKSGLIDRATAFESLATKIFEQPELDIKSIRATTEFIHKLLEDVPLPSQENAAKIAESMVSISGYILSSEETLASVAKEERVKIAENLLNSTEKAGFIYAETKALIPDDYRNPEPFVLTSNNVLLQVEVRGKTFNSLTSSGVTTFPDRRTCMGGSEQCGSDVITIHDADILGQKGEGPAIVVFSLHYKAGQYLSSADSDWEVDSNVISATFQEPNHRAELNKPATIILKHNRSSKYPRRCAYWDHSDGSSGNWSDRGCRLVEKNSTHTTCQCSHLTSFSVLVNHQGVAMEPYHDSSLDVITKVGISISVVCLFLCVLTFSCFRNLCNDRNTVHKHLCICLLVAEIVFLIGIDKTGNGVACSVVAGLLHYFFLSAFLWMALEGFQLYVMLVEVFEESSRLKWYYLSGYGIPAVIVGISAAVDHGGYGTDDVCWLQVESGFIWSFVGPILIIIIVNLGFLAMTVYKMYVHTMAFTDSGKINSIKASVRGASVLLCLLGITWAFGILWISENMAVLAYLFCIFNAFQGMFIFIFHCLLQKKVRTEYSRSFSRFPCCQNIGAESYVANSSSFQKQYARGRFSANANGTVAQQSVQQSQLQRMWNETVAPRNSESTPIAVETPQNRKKDPVRPADTSNRNVKQNTQVPVDRSYLQEDEVFLPPEEGQSGGIVTSNTMGDFHYDRLQHHHHHQDEYLAFHGQAKPMGQFHTGQVSKATPHLPGNARESSNHQTLSEYGQFGQKSLSHSKVQGMLTRQESEAFLQEVPFQQGDSERCDSNRVQSHAYRKSLDETFGGKRDSGISLQRPPSNSRILENAERQGRNGAYRRSTDHMIAGRRKEVEDFGHRGKVRPNFSDRNSLDDDSRQRMICSNHRRSATLDPTFVSRCPIHHSMAGPVMANRSEGQHGHRKRKSLSSDSDDPIVTDCSVSSAGSSYRQQAPVLSHHNNSSYYEEPICHKSLLCDTAQALGQHHKHWHNHSHISDQNRDENDLEVELITSSDNSIEANPGTLGYPPYRPPSPPRNGKDTSHASVSEEERTTISDVSAFPGQGMAITQHNDVYGQPSPGERRPKKTLKRMVEKQPDEIFEVQRRTMPNLL